MARAVDPDRVAVHATADALTLLGGWLQCRLDRGTGRIVELLHAASRDAFVGPQTLPGGLEVFDELDRKWYTDLRTPATVAELAANDREVSFVKRFEGAPFALRCRWRTAGDGVRLHVEALLDAAAAMRSIRISVVLPVTPRLISWAPSYPPPADVVANPVRYCYLADERGKARTGIPMLSLWHAGKGGLSLCIPFEAPKVQLNMGVEPYDPTRWYVPEKIPRLNAGAEVDTVTPPDKGKLGERPVVRFTEKHVGLRPGKALPFAMWFFGHEPDWRPALGRVVRTYNDYFAPSPAFRPFFGGRFRGNPHQVTEEKIEQARPFGLTHTWFHAHFEYHGEFLTDEALTQPDYTWFCEPYPTEFKDLTVGEIRAKIRRLAEEGIGTFLYGFNMHCDPTIIDKRHLHADVCKNEQGDISRAYHDQPVMYFAPDSPFGRQQLDQMDRFLKVYPDILGIALDNWNYAGIDFGHDDGLTMVNHKPAANLNFSQQRMIPAIAGKMHGSGRFVMTNKGRTIESLRGVDAMGTEAVGVETYATFAYMNVCRCVTPMEYKSQEDASYAEYVLKYLLVWGGHLSSAEISADAQQALGYKPLLDELRNRRWVFSPDPLTLPKGCDGQIFRIDSRSPWHGGAVVVTVVRPDASWRDRKFRKGLRVKVRLPDGNRFRKAWWIGVESSAAGPVACKLARKKGEITVSLPPAGAAGVLRLE